MTLVREGLRGHRIRSQGWCCEIGWLSHWHILHWARMRVVSLWKQSGYVRLNSENKIGTKQSYT